MEQPDLTPLLEQLSDNIDGLQDVLDPLLKTTLPETAAKLPLLDKAKLHVLMTYAIESLLFSYLRLSGVNAKEHPVYQELTRVKQYFEKIKATEMSGLADPKRENLSLDKEAAARFITHALVIEGRQR